MKRKKIVSFVLCLALALSLMGTAVLAETRTTHYDTYSFLGDSIPSGYGVYRPDGEVKSVLEWQLVEGSYPQLVGEAVGAQQVNVLARSGFSTVETLRMLDAEYDENLSEEDRTVSDAMIAYLSQTTMDEFTAKREEAIEEISQSDLITVNLGSNDILSSSSFRNSILEANYPQITEIEEEFTEILSAYGETGEKMAELLTTMGSLSRTSLYAIKGYLIFTQNWDRLMTLLHELSPDAKIIAVGMYNPFRHVTLTDSSSIEFGQVATLLVQMMNMYMAAMSPSRVYYDYVDVSDTEVYEFPSFTDPQFKKEYVLDVHPTLAGHKYIAEQIIRSLGTEEVPEDTASSDDPCSAFTDIDKNAWYHDAVDYVLTQGYMAGTSSTTFEPESGLSRAMLVQILYAREGRPASSGQTFSDVPDGQWYSDAVNWAAANKIVAGNDDGTFEPDTAITRQQLTAILYRYAAYTGKDTSARKSLDSFADDASVADYAVEALQWATASGLMAGRENNTLAPADGVTRAETAQMLMRFDQQ